MNHLFEKCIHNSIANGMSAVKSGEATAAGGLLLTAASCGRQNGVGGLSHSCGITPLLVWAHLLVEEKCPFIGGNE